MPETRVERLLAALGLLTAVALIAVVVHDWPAASTSSPRPARVTAPIPTAAKRPKRVATQNPSRKTAQATVGLSITAARADSWFEVRSVSSTGPILYTGILPRGETRSFKLSPLWVRFGAASSIDARIAGRLVSLPGGTYDARFQDGTLQRVGG